MLYLLPVVLACITLGRLWGIIFAVTATTIIISLPLINIQKFSFENSFEISLATGAIYLLIAWFLGGITDIEKNTSKQMMQMANYDELTGLANHRYFHEQLHEKINLTLERNQELSLVLLDIDYFKRYNDAYGHTQGDLVLSELGGVLANNVPPEGFLARYGGEEFALILPKMGLNEAISIGENLRNAVAKHSFSGEVCMPFESLTISAGVANLPYHAKNKQELINAADEALYSGKFTGRNKVRTYLAVLEKINLSVGENEKELIESLRTLMTVVNAKDRYTYGHSERVAYYAKLVGEQLGMDDEALRLLEYGAFLHDIGKIEIPREILNKNGHLTDEEWKSLYQHPRWGADVIASSKVLEPIIPMVLYHHENYDGSGYPQGLMGEDIPLYAKILRVVDSYDAMTSSRPYRNTLNNTEAINEISNCRGKQYDPDIVDAFINVILNTNN